MTELQKSDDKNVEGDLFSKTLETSPETAEIGKSEMRPPEMESSIVEEKQMEKNEDGELETKKIEIPDTGEDDGRYSPSIFSTCDEWVDSLGSGRTTEDPAMVEDTADYISGYPEPDDVDEPPTGLEVEISQTPVGGHTDIQKSTGDQKSVKGGRGVDRKSRDRLSTTSTQTPSNRRPISPSPHGEVSRHTRPTSKGAPRSAPVSRTSRSTDSASTRYSPAPQYARERAKPVKPILLSGKRPAWK